MGETGFNRTGTAEQLPEKPEAQDGDGPVRFFESWFDQTQAAHNNQTQQTVTPGNRPWRKDKFRPILGRGDHLVENDRVAEFKEADPDPKTAKGRKSLF